MVYFSKTVLLKHFRSFFPSYNRNHSVFSHFPLLILFEYILAKIKPLARVPRFCCCSVSHDSSAQTLVVTLVYYEEAVSNVTVTVCRMSQCCVII